MTKTKVINDVPTNDVDAIEAGLRADGYVTNRYQQPDGKFTIIGVKQVADAIEAISSDARPTRAAESGRSMTKTKVVTDIEAVDTETVEAGLRSDGYTTTRQRQPNGKFTVIGVKVVRTAEEAVTSSAAAGTRGSPRSRRNRR